MKNQIKKGVILAAGKGSRLLPLTLNYPKTLLPICNKPLIQYQIEAMRNEGINELIIVIGRLGEKIKSYFQDGSSLCMNIKYVVDEDPKGIASSLLKAKDLLDGFFVLFLGDIFMPNIDLSKVLKDSSGSKAEAIVVAKQEVTFEAVKRNFAIVSEKDNRITKVVEKPKNPPTLVKGIGLYVFSPLIFEAIKKTSPSNLRGEIELTDSIQTLIDRGGKVYSHLQDLWEVNLSYPEDLLECNLRVLKEKNLTNLIGEGVKLGKNSRVSSSVVGDRSIIENSVVMDECLVLPKTVVKKEQFPLYRQILV
ncbi:NTP transferase domain-containing protein [Candidatus Daviesbacteria bacterium]|nr:NTP transferase domain-containing protein [Candidatus Daviesbacteria bacterium]